MEDNHRVGLPSFDLGLSEILVDQGSVASMELSRLIKLAPVAIAEPEPVAIAQPLPNPRVDGSSLAIAKPELISSDSVSNVEFVSDEELAALYDGVDDCDKEEELLKLQKERKAKKMAARKKVKKVPVKKEIVDMSVPVSQPDDSNEFMNEDYEFKKEVAEGGDNSKGVNSWAMNKLERFREFINDDVTVAFVDLSQPAQAELIARFFEQCKKQNGEMYPTQSLMGLLNAFNRVIKRHQDSRITRTGISEIPFHIKASPIFKRACMACVVSMRRSRNQGANKPRKKAAVVTGKSETKIMRSEAMQKIHRHGLQRRSKYFAIFRFGVRGAQELHDLRKNDFVIGKDHGGKYVQYNERLSKNYKVGLKRFQDEHFRYPTKIYEEDVVDTFERYLSRLPVGAVAMWCNCIVGNPSGYAWYSTNPVGLKPCTNTVRELHLELGLDPTDISNKSGRATLVTRMSERGVPAIVGMLLTGHKTQGAYERYNMSTEVKVRAAQRCSGVEDITYEQALQEEMKRMKLTLIDGDETLEASCSTTLKLDEDEYSPSKKFKGLCLSKSDSESVKQEELSTTKEEVTVPSVTAQPSLVTVPGVILRPAAVSRPSPVLPPTPISMPALPTPISMPALPPLISMSLPPPILMSLPSLNPISMSLPRPILAEAESRPVLLPCNGRAEFGDPMQTDAKQTGGEGRPTAGLLKDHPVTDEINLTDDEFLERFNWEEDFKMYEGNRTLAINPITAVLGKLTGCSVNVTFNGSINIINK